MYSEGVVNRGLPLTWMARVLSENPARDLGLYPPKGALRVGADADFRSGPSRPRGRSAVAAPGLAGWTLYEGWKLRGRPWMTLLRGEVVLNREGELEQKPGYGRYWRGRNGPPSRAASGGRAVKRWTISIGSRGSSRTPFAALPAFISSRAAVLLDTLGAILAGSALPENGGAGRVSRPSGGPSGSATLIGHVVKADAFWAALVNATAGVALEVDEGSRLGGGHPSIHTLPGALAVAEERDLDGRRLLEALIAGYEVGSRIGGATTTRGPTSTRTEPGHDSTAVAAAPSATRRRRCARSSTSPPR